MTDDNLPTNPPAINPSIATDGAIPTYEDRRKAVAARLAAEEALPDEVKRLIDGMRWRLISRGKGEDYAELKRLALEIWGSK